MEDSEIQRVWNEIKATGSLNFKYREQATPYELAPFISANMLNYPSNHIISAGYLLDDIDVALFRSYVAKLIPQTAVTVLRSRTFDWLPDDTPNDSTDPSIETKQGEGANRKEPWYGVSYHTEVPSSEQFNKWSNHREGKKGEINTCLSLPGPNPFICYDLANAEIVTKVSPQSSNSFASSSSPSSSSVLMDGNVESEEKVAAPLLRSARPFPLPEGLSCPVLPCTVLPYSTLHCTVLPCPVLPYFALSCPALYCPALLCLVLS